MLFLWDWGTSFLEWDGTAGNVSLSRAYHAQMEFKRRKLAFDAARTYRKCRTDGCTFDEMLELTSPLKRTDVIEQYCIEQELSRAKRAQLLRMAAGTVPWFVALSLTVSYLSTLTMILATPPIVVCDPAFVAEMPGCAAWSSRSATSTK